MSIYKILRNNITQNHLLKNPEKTLNILNTYQKRSLFGWLNAIFNKYDKSRVKEVGADRACAEWLIRCGAGIKWSQNSEWFRDYNELPSLDKSRKLFIYEIDGTDSAVMYVGFEHFRGIQKCRKIIFHKAHYIDDEALKRLPLLKQCLEELQISSCGNVTDEGIMYISQLQKLSSLLLYDLPGVRDRKRCIEFLKGALPYCRINFPYASSLEIESTKQSNENQHNK